MEIYKKDVGGTFKQFEIVIRVETYIEQVVIYKLSTNKPITKEEEVIKEKLLDSLYAHTKG